MFTLQRWIEFTLDIGCINNCAYCPQKTFVSHYFKHDTHRKSSMNLDDFTRILKNIPKDIDIDFAGFSEPFCNAYALDMMEYAAHNGYNVHLYTTLRGLSQAQIVRLQTIPIASCVVHLPDNDGLIKIKVDDAYLENLKLLRDSNINNTSYMVIGQIHNAIPHIIHDPIHQEKIVSRAENLDRKEISDYVEFSHKEKICIDKTKRIICFRRFHNTLTKARPTCAEVTVVLPDGTLVPCCMDFGIQHPLGNLYLQEYNEIMNGSSRMRFEDAMMCKNNDDIICRNCEWAVIWDAKKWNNFEHTGRYFKETLPKRIERTLDRLQTVATKYVSPTYRLLTLMDKKYKRLDVSIAEQHAKLEYLERIVLEQGTAVQSAIREYERRQLEEKTFSYKKHSIRHLEMHVTHSCSLHCRYCSHYCDIGYPNDIDCDSAMDSMRRWALRLDPSVFRLLGGEPLLEKRLPEFIEVAAEVFPHAYRDVVSNGLALARWDDSLPILLQKTKTALTISEHPMSSKEKQVFDEGVRLAKVWQSQYSITLSIQSFTDKSQWKRFYQHSGSDIVPFADGKPEASRYQCHHTRHCVNLHQDKLWQCPPLAYLPLIADKLAKREAWEPYLRYEPLDFSATDFALASFLHNAHGIEFCAMCPSKTIAAGADLQK